MGSGRVLAAARNRLGGTRGGRVRPYGALWARSGFLHSRRSHPNNSYCSYPGHPSFLAMERPRAEASFLPAAWASKFKPAASLLLIPRSECAQVMHRTGRRGRRAQNGHGETAENENEQQDVSPKKKYGLTHTAYAQVRASTWIRHERAHARFGGGLER